MNCVAEALRRPAETPELGASEHARWQAQSTEQQHTGRSNDTSPPATQSLVVFTLLMSCASTTRDDMAAIAGTAAARAIAVSAQWQSSCDDVVRMLAPAFRGN